MGGTHLQSFKHLRGPIGARPCWGVGLSLMGTSGGHLQVNFQVLFGPVRGLCQGLSHLSLFLIVAEERRAARLRFDCRSWRGRMDTHTVAEVGLACCPPTMTDRHTLFVNSANDPAKICRLDLVSTECLLYFNASIPALKLRQPPSTRMRY